MNHKIVLLIAACMQQTHAVVTVKSPLSTTIPLRAKVYGINTAQTYKVTDQEKPAFFKPFDSMVTNYSWKYISKIRPNELGYVLIGYDDKDKAAARQSGAAIFDPTRNQLTEPSQSTAGTPEASNPPTVLVAPTPSDSKQLLLELNVMCTNIAGVPLRKKQINKAIEGGKVYGTSFDLKDHKNCYIVAKKYKDDAPAPEIQEFIEKIYGGILGVGGSLELAG